MIKLRKKPKLFDADKYFKSLDKRTKKDQKKKEDAEIADFLYNQALEELKVAREARVTPTLQIKFEEKVKVASEEQASLVEVNTKLYSTCEDREITPSIESSLIVEIEMESEFIVRFLSERVEVDELSTLSKDLLHKDFILFSIKEGYTFQQNMNFFKLLYRVNPLLKGDEKSLAGIRLRYDDVYKLRKFKNSINCK